MQFGAAFIISERWKGIGNKKIVPQLFFLHSIMYDRSFFSFGNFFL